MKLFKIKKIKFDLNFGRNYSTIIKRKKIENKSLSKSKPKENQKKKRTPIKLRTIKKDKIEYKNFKSSIIKKDNKDKKEDEEDNFHYENQFGYKAAINWFPGHMLKAQRLIKEKLKQTSTASS